MAKSAPIERMRDGPCRTRIMLRDPQSPLWFSFTLDGIWSGGAEDLVEMVKCQAGSLKCSFYEKRGGFVRSRVKLPAGFTRSGVIAMIRAQL